MATVVNKPENERISAYTFAPKTRSPGKFCPISKLCVIQQVCCPQEVKMEHLDRVILWVKSNTWFAGIDLKSDVHNIRNQMSTKG